jgi:hypothetical protein
MITVSMHFNTCIILNHMNTRVVGSNPDKDIDVYTRSYACCGVQADLVMGSFPIQKVLPNT